MMRCLFGCCCQDAHAVKKLKASSEYEFDLFGQCAGGGSDLRPVWYEPSVPSYPQSTGARAQQARQLSRHRASYNLEPSRREPDSQSCIGAEANHRVQVRGLESL